MKKHPETIAFFIYGFLYCLVSAFHEPWFDELQSWQIAKCASYYDMLFVIPHYEGHPSLWWLILSIPAKLEIPCELGLKTVGFIFSMSAMSLLIFKSPFPRKIRLLLPFTYFPFYQYGIIVRPYCMMMLAFMLLAVTFEKKDIRPWPFVGSLIFLSLTSIYGIVIAGGIAIVWLIEIWNHQKWMDFLKKGLRDQRVYALLVLLIFAIGVVGILFPRGDTYAISGIKKADFVRMFYVFFAFPAEATTFSALQNNVIPHDLQKLIPGLFLGIITLILILLYSANETNRKYFVIPYILYSLFCASYFSRYHVGILLLFGIFWLWITSYQSRTQGGWECCVAFAEKYGMEISNARPIAVIYIFMFFVMSLYWNIASAALDVLHPYGAGREIASYIREHHLSQALTMVSWEQKEDSSNTNIGYLATDVCAYFDHNIIFNFNSGRDDEAYIQYRVVSESENEQRYESWSMQGVPELLIGEIDLQSVYGGSALPEEFKPVCEIHNSLIWKGDWKDFWRYLYLKSDKMKKYGSTEVDIVPYLEVQDADQEEFANGVSIGN